MQRFRVQEWLWLGVIAVAVLLMIVVTLEPWLSR